jgi:hypothetical protein
MNRRHVAVDNSFLDSFGTGTLGWYSFYPQYDAAPGDTGVRYHHTDDVDHLGILALTYNYGNTYHLSSWYFKENAGFRRNCLLYKKYDELRRSKYFSNETLARLKASPFEHKLIKKRGGEWAFLERKYQTRRLYDINDPAYKTTEWENPFGKHTPFVRIQTLLTTEGKDPITLMHFDEDRDLMEQPLKITFPSPINMTDRVTSKVRIRGNGKKGGAICIRITGHRPIEYIIDTDFEGKADAAVRAVRDGYDFVYVHLEATDEVSHAQDLQLKMRAIEDFDSRIIGRVRSALGDGAAYCVLPDHPVPLRVGRHTRTPVPVSVCRPGVAPDAVETYSERSCPAGALGAMKGGDLMDLLLG